VVVVPVEEEEEKTTTQLPPPEQEEDETTMLSLLLKFKYEFGVVFIGIRTIPNSIENPFTGFQSESCVDRQCRYSVS
jgi:hypothetical protein